MADPSTVELLRLPKLYENMDEAAIGNWLVSEGEFVERGQPLVELITDKTVLDYESPLQGCLLRQYAPEKSVVPIGYILAAFGDAQEIAPDVSAENQAILEKTKAPPPPVPARPAASPAQAAPVSARPRISPAARALAKKHGIDITDLQDRLSDSRVIHRTDVEAYLDSET